MRARSGPHWQGLDGLRALAVAAVVVYHFSPQTLPGGFLGVDVFFVISGYLITRLLAEEFLRNGRIDAKRFYRRRARRLLPALAVVLVSVTVAALVWRDQLATVRGGVLSTAVFGGNWWLAYDHQPYFVSTGRPSMLQHLWSLGVEEQFYLLWPIAAAATLAAARRVVVRRGLSAQRVLTRLSVVALTLSLASTALMWLLADVHNVPYGGDGSTLYYGTDTHCMGLLLGAALGARAASGRAIAARVRRWDGWLEAAAIAALVALMLFTTDLASYSRSLYRGDFLVVSALVVLVIAVATRPGSAVGRALDIPLLRWIGVRSYSIYLWHWPIAVVTRPGVDTAMPLWLDQLLRVTVVLVLSDLTFRFIETPVRRFGPRAALAAAIAQVRSQWRRLPPRLAVAAPVGLAGLAAVALVVIVVGPAAPRPSAALGAIPGGTHIVLRPPRQRPPVGPPASNPNRLPKLSGFGDSVLLGARHSLATVFPGGSLDAVESRQPGPILADVRAAARRGSLDPLVVLDLGNNGLINPDDLTRTLQSLSGARLVLVFNLHLEPLDRAWQQPNNSTIARVVPGFANARIVDWDKLASTHQGWLYSDDLHLTPTGAVAYARVVAATYRTAEQPTGQPVGP